MLAVIAVVLAVGCTPDAPPLTPRPETVARPEATSRLGVVLYQPPLADDARARMEAQLAEARAEWERNRDDPEALIWVGRRTAYLGRYRDAIDIFTEGMTRHPNDARL